MILSMQYQQNLVLVEIGNGPYAMRSGESNLSITI